MARKTGEWDITHPTTGQKFTFQTIEDGSLRVICHHDGERQKWGVTANFTGGDTGTRIALTKFPVG